MGEARGRRQSEPLSIDSSVVGASQSGEAPNKREFPPEAPYRKPPPAYLRGKRRYVHEEAYGNGLGILVSQSTRSGKQNMEKSEAIKDKDARLFFDSIALDTPCVFLCIGRPEKCRIVQVAVRDDDNDAAILDKMKKAWAKSRAWLPFRKVTRVEEVRLRFSGVDRHRAGKAFIGIYEVLDSERLRRSLDEKLKSIKESIGTREDQDPFSYCREDYTSGEWEHSPECPSMDNHLGNCDFQDFDDVSYRLQSLSLLPILTLAFQNPLLANGQRLLNGLAGDRGVYSHSDLLRNLYRHDPRVGDVDFNGYKVTEEWEDIRHSAAIPLAATFTVCSCATFRVIFGDWQTAIGASSLGVTVLALIVQWAIYVAGKDLIP